MILAVQVLPVSPPLQTTVPGWRASHLQREGVRVPEVQPAAGVQQPGAHPGGAQSVLWVLWCGEACPLLDGCEQTRVSSGCCGCGKEFLQEPSLVALDKHWHLGCFRCRVCTKVLNAEYISR